MIPGQFELTWLQGLNADPWLMKPPLKALSIRIPIVFRALGLIGLSGLVFRVGGW